MKRLWIRRTAAVTAALLLLSACGCGAEASDTETGKGGMKDTALDAKNPVTVTVWNYYNGDQLTAFEQLVEEFNQSVGIEKGIVVQSISQGDVNTLADALLDSVDGKAGAQKCPNLAAIYSETAYILDQSDRLVNLDMYFTEEEENEYVSAFLDEGRFNEGNELLLFPISKSTEVFTANKTDWEAFAQATGITLNKINTQEDLVAAAEAYYKWTDEQTPEVADDGRALYGRDSLANYIYVGSKQLGHELFTVKEGRVTIDMDRDTFKTLWDNYYIPYIKGYFGAYARFRSEDAKTGKILALTSSTSGAGYLPTQVTLSDDTTHEIELYTAKTLPFADAQNDAVVQQGASFCLVKSTEAEQEGAVEFLKWFTKSERNLEFSLNSGYSPVTVEANDKANMEAAIADKEVSAVERETQLIAADMFENDEPYATKPFKGSKEIRSFLENSLQDTCAKDRAAIESAIAAGTSREDAIASYCTEAYFDRWFTNISEQVESLTK